MKTVTLNDLQASVQDPVAFDTLDDYLMIGRAFLSLIKRTRPTRIVSPFQANYIFFQYDEAYGHKITRPLNIDLFIESNAAFQAAFERFTAFLADLKRYGAGAVERKSRRQYGVSREINQLFIPFSKRLAASAIHSIILTSRVSASANFLRIWSN
jgi:hypothetical protein